MRAQKASLAVALLALLALLLAPVAARASFGIAGLKVRTLEQNGTLDLRAASHPDALSVELAMNLDGEEIPEGTLSQVIVDLPAGMVGNPLALPRCPAALFEGQQPHCPGESQVGIVRLKAVGFPIDPTGPVYNLTPPLGVAASIGFSVINFNSFQEASLRTGSDYGVKVSDITVPTKIQIKSLTETIWGVPAASSHDDERICAPSEGPLIHGCESEVPPAPFLTLPTSCGAPLVTDVTVGSVQEPFNPQSAHYESRGEEGDPQGLHGCDAPPFAPTIEAQPETAAAESSTGLDVDVHVPQNQDPGGLATAHLKQTTFALPAGMALNPSAADGLAACTPAQIDLHGPGPAACPAASELGTVAVSTALIDHPLPGKVYLASQLDNPFGSLLALYITVHDPTSGVVVKLAGRVNPNPITGRLVTTVAESPQLPFEDFQLHFSGGPRGALTTPPTCGTYTAAADLVPWSAPEGPTVTATDSFQVSSGCAGSEAELPNSPSFEAGTQTPLAGAYSPLIFKVARENGSQKLSAIDATLPPGLTSKLAGLTQCTDAQLAQAAARSNPGQGAEEQSSPSCPASSQFGTATVGAGSGSPIYVTGNAYLAGPYKGAPLSLAFITPAVAGPFDLGVVVVRAPAFVDPTTAQISVSSDPIPSILHGIPLDVRSIAVNASRPEFTLNPTSCEPMSIGGTAISTLGNAAALSNRFQVGGCNGLDYAPKLYTRLFGATKRGGHPKFRAVFAAKPGEANTDRLAVNLPRSEFLDQAHIRTVCTRVQFNAAQGNGASCPAGARYGYAKAYTPLLDEPLQGPVFLRSSNHKLPDLVIALEGPASLPLAINLVGRVNSKHGGIRNTIEAAPDAPVSKVILTMQGGKKGLLVNSRDICAKTYRSTVKMTGHNGKQSEFSPAMSNSRCNKQRKHKRHHG